jgi:hypothetical protein
MEISNPKVIADRGEKIYNENYKTAFEVEHPGKFVAIDIQSKQAFLGGSAEDALDAARKASPQGLFHLIKVGSQGAFRVSYNRNENLDWLSQ